VPDGGRRVLCIPDARGAIARLHQQGKIKETTDIALSEYLLMEARRGRSARVLPSAAEGYIRLSFATSMGQPQGQRWERIGESAGLEVAVKANSKVRPEPKFPMAKALA